MSTGARFLSNSITGLVLGHLNLSTADPRFGACVASSCLLRSSTCCAASNKVFWALLATLNPPIAPNQIRSWYSKEVYRIGLGHMFNMTI